MIVIQLYDRRNFREHSSCINADIEVTGSTFTTVTALPGMIRANTRVPPITVQVYCLLYYQIMNLF